MPCELAALLGLYTLSSPCWYLYLIIHVSQQAHVIALLSHKLPQQVQQQLVEVCPSHNELAQLALELPLLAVLLQHTNSSWKT